MIPTTERRYRRVVVATADLDRAESLEARAHEFPDERGALLLEAVVT